MHQGDETDDFDRKAISRVGGGSDIIPSTCPARLFRTPPINLATPLPHYPHLATALSEDTCDDSANVSHDLHATPR